MGNFMDGMILGWLPSMLVVAWLLWRVPLSTDADG